MREPASTKRRGTLRNRARDYALIPAIEHALAIGIIGITDGDNPGMTHKNGLPRADFPLTVAGTPCRAHLSDHVGAGEVHVVVQSDTPPGDGGRRRRRDLYAEGYFQRRDPDGCTRSDRRYVATLLRGRQLYGPKDILRRIAEADVEPAGDYVVQAPPKRSRG